MNYDRVDFVRGNVNVAIRNSTIQPPPDALIQEVCPERIGPVCSPDYLAANPLRHAADLAGKRLLASTTRPDSWAEWLTATGSTGSGGAAQRFDHFYLVIQAAACGLGIAAVPQMLVMEELRTGRLVAPFGFTQGPRRLSLWTAPQSGNRRDVCALNEWLSSELASCV